MGPRNLLATDGQTDLSIIIVNYKSEDVLRHCLSSITATTDGISFEVIVVDNSPGDGLLDFVARDYPKIRLIVNAVNRGFAAGCNQGMGVARGRYLLLLNPDTVVTEGAIRRTIDFADRNPSAAIVGCQVRINEREIQMTCFRYPSTLNAVLAACGADKLPLARWLPGNESIAGWDRKSTRDVDVVTGCFMLARAEAVEDVGMMDERYFVYAEEADWCYRFTRAGWRVVFYADAVIIHIDGGGVSTNSLSKKMYIQKRKSLLLFFRKNYGRMSFRTARAAYILYEILRVAIYSILSIFPIFSGSGADCRRERERHKAALVFLAFFRPDGKA